MLVIISIIRILKTNGRVRVGAEVCAGISSLLWREVDVWAGGFRLRINSCRYVK